jgi:hypothetical protein
MSSIVVADAGPLHYLVLIDCGETLGTLFDHVLIPFAVRDELLRTKIVLSVISATSCSRSRLCLLRLKTRFRLCDLCDLCG